MIYMFTIATGAYNKYLKKFIETFSNIFPNINKQLIIISDQNHENINNVYVYHIPNCNYALCTLQKYIYIDDAIKYLNLDINNNDLIMFTDVDVYFLEKSDEYWNNLYNKFLQSDYSLSIFPWNYSDNNKYQIATKYIQTNSISDTNKYRYNVLAAAFLCCNKYWFDKFIYVFNLLLKYDMINYQNNCRIFPILPEQEYLNKIMQENLIQTDNIFVDYFLILADASFLKEKNHTLKELIELNENIFIIKNYNTDIKYCYSERNWTKETILQELQNITKI